MSRVMHWMSGNQGTLLQILLRPRNNQVLPIAFPSLSSFSTLIYLQDSLDIIPFRNSTLCALVVLTDREVRDLKKSLGWMNEQNNSKNVNLGVKDRSVITSARPTSCITNNSKVPIQKS